jgi:uncharacterized membrane protein YhaH (DUF805 family)
MKKLFLVARAAVSTFWGAIKSGLRKYVKFKGRATRTEYWCFILFLYLLALIPATFILSGIEDAQSAYQTTSSLISDIQGPSVETTKDISIDSQASDDPISKAEESNVETAKGMALAFLGFFAMSSVVGMFALGLILFAIFRLLIPLLSLSVMVRRLHDTGRSGWACLIGLVPFIGGLTLFMWLCEDSDPGENEYGENPKGL